MNKAKELSMGASSSETIKQARSVATALRQRNGKTWDELDHETVHAINALVAFAQFQFNRANTAPPKREWVDLTDEDVGDVYVAWDNTDGASFAGFARAIETKIKEKNHD